MLATGCLAVVAELVINYNLTGLDTISRTDYVKNLADYRAVLSETAEKVMKIPCFTGRRNWSARPKMMRRCPATTPAHSSHP